MGEGEKGSFYCFARQRGPRQANALKTLSPLEEDRRRSCSLGVENRAADKDGVEASLHSSSKLVFSDLPLWFSFVEAFICRIQRYFCAYFLEEEPGPCPQLHCGFSTLPLGSLLSRASLMSHCLNPLWNSGKVMEAATYFPKQGKGDTGRLVPRNLTGSCSVS